MSADDVRVIETDLARFYDQEEGRENRAIDPARLEARTRFLDRLRRGDRVLEVGPGPGRDAVAFGEAGCPIIGLELSRGHALRAASRGVTMAVGSARALPFATECFDGLWTMSALMHIPNTAIDGAMRELARVLRPGAIAAIGVWSGPDVEHRSDKDLYDPPRFFSRRSEERWRALLGIVGTVDVFELWGNDGDDFRYHFAIVTKG